MNKNNTLSLSFHEWKLNYKRTLLFFILSTFVFSLSFCCLSFSFNLKNNIINNFDNQFEKGIEIRIEKIEFPQLLILNNFVDYINVILYKYQDVILEYKNYELKTKGIDNVNGKEIYYNYFGTSYILKDSLPNEFKDINLKAGRYWTEDDNYTNNIFISDFIADKLKVSVNDTIKIKENNYNKSIIGEFIVKGIYLYNENMPYYVYATDFLFSLPKNTDIFDYYGIEYNSFQGIVNNYYNINKLININMLGSLFDIVGTVRMAETVLITLSVTIMIAAVAVMSNIVNIMIKFRQNFIAKLKMLGAPPKFISNIYFFIFILNVFASIIISFFINILLKNYFEKIGTALFQYNFRIKYYGFEIIIFILTIFIILLFDYFILNKKIKKINTIDYLKNI